MAPADPARRAAIFTREQTGLRFESLVLFAEPLFTAYGLDVSDAFALKDDPSRADEPTVAVLEAARLFWAYFSLPLAERDNRLAVLQRHLLGPEHSIDDEADLDDLLDEMLGAWNILEAEERELAEDVDHTTPGFDELLKHPLFAEAEGGHAEGAYGSERMSEVEARALFAQPLLDHAENPDEMDDAMDRANAYWDLAHAPAEAREEHLESVLGEFATSAGKREQIRAEAERMLARFRELFG